jgi:RNA polymerase sigma factor (sigma-70 family)
MTRAAISESTLVARCRRGDRDAWGEIIDRFSGYVYAIAVHAYGLSEADAEDVFQEAFTRTYERLDQLREDEAIRPWLGQLTRRLSIDRLRSRAREVPEEQLLDLRADDVVARLDEALAIQQALAELPAACRDVLVRFFLRDESYRAIGEELGIPPGTVASRISRCLARLREQLEGRETAPGASRVL